MGIYQMKEINLVTMNKPSNYSVSPYCKRKPITSEKYSIMNDIQDLETHPVTPSCTSRNQTKFRPVLDFRKRTKEKKINKNCNQDTEDLESCKFELKKKKNKDLEDSDLINHCLAKNFFMQSLDKHARKEITKEMSLVFIKANTVIFSHGKSGRYFYILKTGSVELLMEMKQIRVFNKGESFGEIALLHDTPRSGTARAITDCYLWVIYRESFKKIADLITRINYKENMSFIESIYLLSHLEHYLKTILASSLYKLSYKAGTTIVNKGNQASCIFIIKEGEVNCVKDKVVIRTLTKGDNFGERSILINSTRTMDVIAKTDTICYSISVNTLKTLLGPHYKTMLYFNLAKHVLHNSLLFKRFHFDLIEKVFDLFEAVNLSDENVAFPIGHVKSSTFVIVIDGNLINAKTGVIVANRGTVLFEKEILNDSNDTTSYAIIPEPDCLFLEADTKKVLELIGGSFIEVMNQCEIIKTLSEVLIFNNIPKAKLAKIAEIINTRHIPKGERIYNNTKENKNYFFVVKSGALDLYIEGVYLKTVNEKDYFGEKELLSKEFKVSCCIAIEDTELYTLRKEAFFNNLDPVMKKYLLDCLYLQDNRIELKDLVFIKRLGVGNYGAVSLVRSITNNYLYAIKAISRKRIDHDKLHNHLELEKSILLHIHHPFIVKLVKCLKDDQHIYFLMEYIRGKEMFDVIRDIGLLNKEQTHFFSGCLIKAIEYLHKRKFIYRDIKPENIMIKENGYVKLIDFGTAKKINDDYTSTILGTPHYMAPEVITGKGYSFQVDYWSIAICMYEFVCGNVPFGEIDDDPMSVYLSLVNQELSFPSFVLDREFKNLISNMLAKNPLTRLTRSKSIQSHFWYRDFNWESLMALTIIPPYLPLLKKEKNKELNISFIHYMQSNVVEWIPSRSVVISDKTQAEYDKWYNNY